MMPLSMMDRIDGSRKSVLALTCRELQILDMLTNGMANRDIAADFGTSERTVETQVRTLLCKLGLRNRTALASWWTAEQMGKAA